MVLAQWLERGLGQLVAPDGSYEQQPPPEDPMDTRSELLWQFMAPDPDFAAAAAPTPDSSSDTTAARRGGPPPRQVFDDDDSSFHRESPPAATVLCIHCHLETPIHSNNNDNNVVATPKTQHSSSWSSSSLSLSLSLSSKKTNLNTGDRYEPATIFLSPTQAKWKSSSRRQSTLLSPTTTTTTPTPPTPTPLPVVLLQERVWAASQDTWYMQQRNAEFQQNADRLFKCCSSSQVLQEKALASVQRILQANQTRCAMTQHAEPNLLLQARSYNLGSHCPDGYTILQAAAKANQVQVAGLVWQHAAATTASEQQPQQQQQQHDHPYDIRRELLEQTNLYGQTALHIAAGNGQVEMAQFLQQKEQELMLSSLQQQTPTSQNEKQDRGAAAAVVATPQQQQQQQVQFTTPSSTSTTPAQDVAGITAWGTAMTSPNPKARKHRQRLDALLSTPLQQYQQQRKNKTTAAISSLQSKLETLSLGEPNRDKNTSPSSLFEVHQARAPLDFWYTTAHLDGQRVWNEDAILCTPLEFCQGFLFLICDGHGDAGSVANFIAQQLPTALARAAHEISSQTFHENNDPDSDRDTEYWTSVCQAAATLLDCDLQKAHLAGGCTAVWAIVTATQIVVANVGDSRCILVQQQQQQQQQDEENNQQAAPQDGGEEENNPQWKVVPLSHDHKPNLPMEQERIEKAGLEVICETYQTEDGQSHQVAKVQLTPDQLLAVSRAFGDFEYKNKKPAGGGDDDDDDDATTAVLCTPDVQVRSRQRNLDRYLILACDGIWDVQSNRQVADFVVVGGRQQPRRDSGGGGGDHDNDNDHNNDNNNSHDLAETAQALAYECWHSGDNLSLILVSFVVVVGDDTTATPMAAATSTTKALLFQTPEKGVPLTAAWQLNST
ncbi:hypothetical protein ACA910_002093 [Epithemia clementina (nom. ined.)]